MSYFSDLAIEYEEKAIKTELIRDYQMIDLALKLALRNTTILYKKIEQFRRYNSDCILLDDLEQKIFDMIEDLEIGLKL